LSKAASIEMLSKQNTAQTLVLRCNVAKQILCDTLDVTPLRRNRLARLPAPWHAFSVKSFSNLQVNNLADIARDLGQVAAASVVIPAILERPSMLLALVGLLLAISAWATSHLLLNVQPL
jgi:hypothetical protein